MEDDDLTDEELRMARKAFRAAYAAEIRDAMKCGPSEIRNRAGKLTELMNDCESISELIRERGPPSRY